MWHLCVALFVEEVCKFWLQAGERHWQSAQHTLQLGEISQESSIGEQKWSIIFGCTTYLCLLSSTQLHRWAKCPLLDKEVLWTKRWNMDKHRLPAVTQVTFRTTTDHYAWASDDCVRCCRWDRWWCSDKKTHSHLVVTLVGITTTRNTTRTWATKEKCPNDSEGCHQHIGLTSGNDTWRR